MACRTLVAESCGIMRAVSAADIEVPCAKMPAYTISSSFSELRFATEHEPTEAHLGIVLEQQLR
jgi:hypothetical protein